MGLAAVVGPNWVGNNVVTAIVVLGVVFVAVSVAVWVVKRLPNPLPRLVAVGGWRERCIPHKGDFRDFTF